MLPATVPNLDPRDHAFTLDTGETVAVRVDPQPFRPTDTTVNVLIGGRLVDPATGVTLTVGGHVIQAQPHAYGVTAEALADGADLTVIVANGMDQEAQRARRLRAALTSLAALGGGPASA